MISGRQPTFRTPVRNVPPPAAEERQARRDVMERAIRFGAASYRDAEGRTRYVFFREANNAPVEAWKRDREAKRGYRRTQYARKAAAQPTIRSCSTKLRAGPAER